MPKCPDCLVYLTCDFKICTKDADRPVERDYQWWRCGECDARFTAELIEDKTNVFNDDLEHTGYRVDVDEWTRSIAEARRCPTAGVWPCACSAHQHAYSLLPRGSISFC